MRMITTNDVILKVEELNYLAYGLPVCRDVMDMIYEVFVKYYSQFGLDGYIKRSQPYDPSCLIQIKCCDGIAKITNMTGNFKFEVEVYQDLQHQKELCIDERRPI